MPNPQSKDPWAQYAVPTQPAADQWDKYAVQSAPSQPDEMTAPAGADMGSGEGFISHLRANHPLARFLLPDWQKEKEDLTATEEREGQLAGQSSSAARFMVPEGLPYGASELLNSIANITTPRNEHMVKGLAAGMERDIPEDPRLWTTAAWSTALGGLSEAADWLGPRLPESLGRVVQPAMMGINAGLAAGFGGQGAVDLWKSRHEHGLVPNIERANDAVEIAMGLGGALGVGRGINAMRDMQDFQKAQATPQAETPHPSLATPLTERVGQVEPQLEPTPQEIAEHRDAMLKGYTGAALQSQKFPSLPEDQQLAQARLDLKTQEAQAAAMIRDQAEAYPGVAADLLKSQNPRVNAWYKEFGGPDIQQEAPPEVEKAGEAAERGGDLVKGLVNQQLAPKKEDDTPQKVARNAALMAVEDEMRDTSQRIRNIGAIRAVKEPSLTSDLSDEAIQSATGRRIGALMARHFTDAEQADYRNVAGRVSNVDQRVITPQEAQAVAALGGQQAAPDVALKAFVKDNELDKEIDREVFQRFRQSGLPQDTQSLRAFNAQNRMAVARDIADLHGFSAAPEEGGGRAEAEEAMATAKATGTGSGYQVEEARGRTEADRAQIAAMRLEALKREELLNRNMLTRVQVQHWQDAYAKGGESSLTPDEVKNMPAPVRAAIAQAVRARKAAALQKTAEITNAESTPTPTAEEGGGTVVPQPAETTPASETPAASTPSGPEEGLVEERGVIPPGEQPQAQTPPSGTPPPPEKPAAAAPEPKGPSRYDASTLQGLTNAIETQPKFSLAARAKNYLGLNRTANEYVNAKEKAATVYNGVKWAVANAWQSYRHPLAWTNFDDAVGHYTGTQNQLAWNLRNFVKAVVPRLDKPTREAMVNYIQADGDMDLLRERASQVPGKFKAGYEAAMKLTDQQKATLDNIRKFQQSEYDEAVKAGMLNQAVQNYVMQLWRKPTEYTNRLMANLNFGELQTNPTFARQRVFDSYFDGEMAGFEPRNKDIAYLIAAHHSAFGRAVAARAFIRQLTEGTATDGRPLAMVAGVGVPIESEQGDKAYLIRPNAVGKWTNANGDPIDVHDYRVIDHPAMRGWKWVAPGKEGPVLLQGDLRVHPEVYARLKNILSNSAIAANPVGRALLRSSGTAKHTLLTLSFFHQTQEGIHAWGHGVNPFYHGTKPLDLGEPLQQELVNHGLMVADFGAESDMAEGVGSTGLLKYVPLAGPIMNSYQDYLFRDYIPRLKMEMAKQAFTRNMGRYAGKMSRDQILALTARQANAAFGGLNYKLLGRNPTTQDVLRLTMLAPDFMEARARFAAQAFMPTGMEQFRALMKLAAVQYIGARIANYAINKDPHWDPQDAFSIMANGNRYQLRSVPGDMLRAFTESRQFVQHRANPLVVRPMIEWYTGRDEFGRQRTGSQEALDYLRNIVPIPLQGPVKKGDQTLADSILTSVGIEASKYHTPGEQLALSYLRTHESTGPEDEATLEKQRAFTQLREGLKQGKVGWDQVAQLAANGKLTDKQLDYLAGSINEPDIVRWTNGLPYKQAMDVYEHASKSEQQQLLPIMIRKIGNSAPANEQEQLYSKLHFQ